VKAGALEMYSMYDLVPGDFYWRLLLAMSVPFVRVRPLACAGPGYSTRMEVDTQTQTGVYVH
jgi:hypothetical protein